MKWIVWGCRLFAVASLLVSPVGCDCGGETRPDKDATVLADAGIGDAFSGTDVVVGADASQAPDAAVDDADLTGDSGADASQMVDASAPDTTPLVADGGLPDVSVADTATADTLPIDASSPDTGSPDTGSPDTGSPDTGSPDAGSPDIGQPDAGSPDIGQPDAGAPDIGTPPCELTTLPTDVRLTNADGFSSFPSVAPTTAGFAVAFDDDRADPGNTFYNDRQIFFSTFLADGTATGVEVAVTAAIDGDALRPQMVNANGDLAMVYQSEAGTSTSIHFASLAENGTFIVNPTVIAQGYLDGPSLAWNGSGYGVVFSGRDNSGDHADVRFMALDAAGQMQGAISTISDGAPAQGVSGSYSHFAKITWGDSHYGVVWQDRRTGHYEIYFRRVASDGATDSSELVLTSSTTEISSAAAASVIWNGTEFGVAYSDTRGGLDQYQVYFARVAADGSQVLQEQRISHTSGNADTPMLASWQGLYWISWIDKVHGEPGMFSPTAASPVIDAGWGNGMPFNGSTVDIGAVEYGCSFGLRDPMFSTDTYISMVDPAVGVFTNTVSNNTSFAAFPAMALLGDDLFVTWFDERDGNREVYANILQCQ